MLVTNNRYPSDDGDLAADYVPVDEDEAIEIAGSTFGLRCVAARRFATEKDDTFRVTTDAGENFILKVANPSEAPLELDFQVSLMRHVVERAPDLPVPRAWPALDGAYFPKIITRANEARYVRLLTYLPGVPLITTTSSSAERQHIGELLARMRIATADFQHAADDRVMAWDVKRLLSLEHLTRHVLDPQHRANVEAGLDRFRAILPALQACRTQVLHNDFNQNNILVDHGDPHFVTGIIDFGDSVRTAVAVDVSTAVMNQLPNCPPDDLDEDIFEGGRDIVRGYLRHADLTDEELAIIPHLAMGRVITRALLTTWRAGLFPENSAYILRLTPQGWRHLAWFLHRSAAQVSALLQHL